MKERVITAICLLVVALPLIYFGGYWFVGLGLVAASIAIFEMMAMYDNAVKVAFINKVLTLMATLSLVFMFGHDVGRLIYPVFFFVLLIQVFLKKMDMDTFGFYGSSVVYIGFSFRALLEIRNHSLTLFIFLIVIVILTDTMAYFTGRFFGKRKLAPKVSPNKTVEGAIGGWLAGAAFALIFGLSQNLFTYIWVLIVLAVGLPILSQLGDLLASALKRKYGIKDYGKLFPGHGGVMDRVDSQLLAAILIYIMILIGGVL